MRAVRHGIGALTAVAAVGLSAPAMAVASHEQQVVQALFEICPRVLSGQLGLNDPQTLAELGYRVPEGDFKRPAAQSGRDETTILILGPSDTEHSCSAIFAAPKAELFHKIEARARVRGFDGPPPVALSSTLRFVDLKTPGEAGLRFSMFDIDAAGGVDYRPLMAAGLAPADKPAP